MLGILRIAMNLISLVINLGLVYFGVRLVLIFKGGRMEKPWLYMASGAFALAMGSSLFSMYYIFNLPGFVHPTGGIVSMIGGALILAGLRREYKNWREAK